MATTGHQDGFIRVWDTKTGEELRAFKAMSAIHILWSLSVPMGAHRLEVARRMAYRA